ncbi:FIST N-terminal domain-containing protein [Zoogloea sp. LCSB751]|uniref:FIST N-terminal domain-containing protein n=1 Tax=Zoogloea sp. LCSB751 TaxID=1965277 RepID=UPI0009A4F711|nr:FIST N-terminal domain-containing protein [Zoogloea sp. LCSB751]
MTPHPANGAPAKGIRVGESHDADATAAARQLAGELVPAPDRLSLVFASSNYAPEQLEAGFAEAFGRTPLIGCTTAGEIGPRGYQQASLAGASLGDDVIDFEIGLLDGLDRLDPHCMAAFARDLRNVLQARHSRLDSLSCFAFMLVDGLCGREESVARAFHDGLGGIPLSGGSAGDDLHFVDTRVIYKGRLVDNAAVLLVGVSHRPLEVFQTQHFAPTDARLIVTGAIPAERRVTELNGCAAAGEYAHALGLDVAQLTPAVFAANPVLVRIGGADFVRSIQRANPDGSLDFFCAIDRGIVFKIAHGEDLLTNLDKALDAASGAVGEAELILGCDCILRRLAATETGLSDQVGQRFADARVVGFNTFGEQFRGLHLNQTFTGIAFGREPRR